MNHEDEHELFARLEAEVNDTNPEVADLDAERHRRRGIESRPSTSPDDEHVMEGEIVPVDRRDPDVRFGVTMAARMAAADAARQPILPPWLRSKDEAFEVVRWNVMHYAHKVGYQAARIPKYYAKLTFRSPRGAWKVAARVVRWVFDAEGAPLRAETVRRAEVEQYLRLTSVRNDRVKLRLILAGLGSLAGFVTTLIVLNMIPSWSAWALLGGLIAVLGVIGAPADAPLIDRAVLPHRVQRLTSDIVVRALGALGIAEINKALSKGGGITFPAPITRDGPGWRADVDLPYGVTAVDVLERRDRLASGLRRPLGCVWPEPAHDAHAGRLVLWVGDQDMSQTKPAAWPLAKHGQADLFKPVPFGTDQRGRLVSMQLMYANVLIGAMPGAGKTFALRALLLAAALDSTAQLGVFELKGSGDLSPLEPVAHGYASGVDDATLEATVDYLREVYADLEKRAKTIAGLPRAVCPENKVTPELAARRSLKLHPRVVAIDECQELFAHPVYGKEAEELCVPILKRGRALGVILLLATQRPDKDSLPKAISANVGIRFCLRVMGQVENDMILGTSMYQNGVRASTFTVHDKGIGYLVGATADPQICRSAYLDAPAAEAVVARARALREAAGTISGHAAGQSPVLTADAASVTLLDDVLAVLPAGEGKVWSETVVDRLADLRPEVYGPHAAGDGKTKALWLSAALKPWRVGTEQVWGAPEAGGKGANRRGIQRDHIIAAITERDRNRRAG